MSNRDKALDMAERMIRSFEGGVPLSDSGDDFVACSMCFYDQGLRIDAARLGREHQSACPSCGREDGLKLSLARVDALARRFFVWGSVQRHEYGATPKIQFNCHQSSDIKVDAWLKDDLEKLERLLDVGFFHYGPRFWMFGEVEPLKALQDPATREKVISRVVAEYPTTTIGAERPFFRLRRSPVSPSNPLEYDTPPSSMSGSGRFDGAGQEVLYGSPDLEVCVHECRVSAEDELFVATLAPSTELRLLNLSALLREEDSVTEFESLDMAIYMLFLAGKHSYGIAQAIALAAKSSGFDGLIYPSYFSMLRTGSVPFETAYGLSSRRFASHQAHEEAKAVPNLAIFGRPIKDGRTRVQSIDRLILRRVAYDFHFGPATIL